MRPLCFILLWLGACAQAQLTTTRLEIVKESKLPKDIFDIVAVGGPNAGIQCDAQENIWIPGLRGYSSAVSSLVRYRPGEAILHIDIDTVPRLKNGNIEYFSPLRDGNVLALVRTVAEYDEVDGRPTTPKRYVDTFAVTFTPAGTVSEIVQMRLPSSAAEMTALAKLQNGWLVAGYTHDSTFIDMRAYVFDGTGSFKKEIVLPGAHNTASQTGSAESIAVFRPTVLRTTDGSLLVFRGFSSQSFYRFSDSGELLEAKKLEQDGIEFWSPRLIGNSLMVRADVHPEKIGKLGSIPVVRFRSAFPIFDLATGKMLEVMTWMDYGSVGCFDGTHLTVLKQANSDSDDSTWRVLTLERVPRTHGPKT
jgi:hypothetical protein